MVSKPALLTQAAWFTPKEGFMPFRETEVWAPVLGHEGAYTVSNLGRVRSLARRIFWTSACGAERSRVVSERVLRTGWHPSGHRHVNIAGTTRKVHHLVLEAFVGPCPAGCEALHKNGRADDNRVTNLRWGTRSANQIDKFYHTGRALSREQVLYLRKRAAEGFYYGERRHLALAWGVDSGIVSRAASGREYAHVR